MRFSARVTHDVIMIHSSFEQRPHDGRRDLSQHRSNRWRKTAPMVQNISFGRVHCDSAARLTREAPARCTDDCWRSAPQHAANPLPLDTHACRSCGSQLASVGGPSVEGAAVGAAAALMSDSSCL